ncbi:MAG: hypothetical protein IJK02_03660 [Clostridia bacterium]|nr:hypothetical protein [Clostridia bacterium]
MKKYVISFCFILLLAFTLFACAKQDPPAEAPTAAGTAAGRPALDAEVPYLALAKKQDIVAQADTSNVVGQYEKQALLPLPETQEAFPALSKALSDLNDDAEARVDKAFETLTEEAENGAAADGAGVSCRFFLQRADEKAVCIIEQFEVTDKTGTQTTLTTHAFDTATGEKILLSSLLEQEETVRSTLATELPLPETDALLYSLDTDGVRIWTESPNGARNSTFIDAGGEYLKKDLAYFTSGEQGRSPVPGLLYRFPDEKSENSPDLLLSEAKTGELQCTVNGESKTLALKDGTKAQGVFLLRTAGGRYLYVDCASADAAAYPDRDGTLCAFALDDGGTPVADFPALQLTRTRLPWGESAFESVVQPAVPYAMRITVPKEGNTAFGGFSVNCTMYVKENGVPETEETFFADASGWDLCAETKGELPLVDAADLTKETGKLAVKENDRFTLCAYDEENAAYFLKESEGTRVVRVDTEDGKAAAFGKKLEQCFSVAGG